jgi:hypothetical protein
MKNLKTYRQLFESVGELTPEQIEWLDKCTDGTWKINPQTGLVDVDGDFNCSEQDLTDFKGIRFGVVSGYFYCSNNQLISLEGAPQKVGEDFYCRYNQLTSLVGAPQEVGANFNCEDNQLISLEGAPQRVGHDFYCSDNQLTSLEGAPQRVGRGFSCNNNQLTSLEGAPQEVGERFLCEGNNLTSLEGAPQEVGGSFNCDRNQLTSLEGAPQKVGGGFYCEKNPVSEETLKSIFSLTKEGNSYLQAVETLWNEIPLDDQALLYRPEFEWVSPEFGKKLDVIKAYAGFKGMI